MGKLGRRVWGTRVGAAAVIFACIAPAARASDRIYFSTGSAIEYANLDGTGGIHNLYSLTSGAARGIALDPAANKIYWADYSRGAISYGNLDGSSAPYSDLPVVNVSGNSAVSTPYGVSLYNEPGFTTPSGQSIYWMNYGTGAAGSATIGGGWERLDGSTGGTFAGTRGTAANGVVVDPVFGRMYWADRAGNAIMQGTTNPSTGGSYGSSISTAAASPVGVALDTDQLTPGATSPPGRIFWTNFNGGTAGSISSIPLSGGTASTLSVSGATLNAPKGIAIDPDAGRVYWANNANNGNGTISTAKLDGTGGQDVLTGLGPDLQFVALLEVPRGTGAPTISGSGSTGSPLSCSSGSWARDLGPSFLYRAPNSKTFGWLLNGSVIAGASGSTYTPLVAGTYQCTETAGNAAGSATQTSSQLTVTEPAGGSGGGGSGSGGGQPTSGSGGAPSPTGGQPGTGTGSTTSGEAELERLLGLLSPGGVNASIRHLLTHGGCTLVFHAPGAGRLTVHWYLRSTRPRSTRARRGLHTRQTLVAAGSAIAGHAGSLSIRLLLTRAGRAALLHASHATLTQIARFAIGSVAVQASRQLRLRR